MNPRRLSLLLLALTLLPGCGYHLAGVGGGLPPSLKTVSIPPFRNQTSRAQIDVIFTAAVRDELVRRSKLKLIEKVDEADAHLDGEIVACDVRPISTSDQLVGSLYEVRVTLNLRLIDRVHGELLFEGTNLTYTDSYPTDESSFYTLETQTLERIAKKAASSAVATMVEAF